MAEKLEFDLKVRENQLNKALSQATDQSTFLGKTLSTSLGVLVGGAALKGLAAISQGLATSFRDAVSFSRGLAEINSILPKTSKLTQETTNSFIELSKQYGSDAQTQAKAFYNIVSAGVQGTAKQLETLQIANEAATAGLVDINTSATILVSSINAYATSGLTATQASDSLFQAVKDGQTTFNELAASLGQVAPLASSAGVSFQDLNGTIAFLTASGIKTPQAITGIRAAITAIIKPTQEATEAAQALGLEFGIEGVKNAGGFAQFLGKVREATGGSTAAIAKLFGSVEATNAILAVAGGNFQKFTELINNNKNSLDATREAAEEVKSSLDFKLDVLGANFKGVGLSIANFFVPVISKAVDLSNQFFSIFQAQTEQGALDNLTERYAEVTEELEKQRSILAEAQNDKFSVRAAGEAKIARDNIAALSREYDNLFKKIQEKTNTGETGVGTGDADAASRLAAEAENNAKIIQLTIDRDLKIKELREQASLDALNTEKESENAFIENEFARNEAELQRLIEFDTLKKELEFSLAEQRAALILDEGERKLELARIQAQRELEFTKIANQNLIKADQASAKERLAVLAATNANEQRAYQTRTNYISAAATLGASLTKQGSVAQFAIQKGAALASIALERFRAIAAIPAQTASLPAPAVPAAAASLLANANSSFALGLAGIATSSIQQFENGGFVGGMNGVSVGGDNRVATLRDGEFVLNGNDQKVLSDAIKSGNLGGGDIIIQIDGRTIARAVRDQVKQGFVLA